MTHTITVHFPAPKGPCNLWPFLFFPGASFLSLGELYDPFPTAEREHPLPLEATPDSDRTLGHNIDKIPITGLYIVKPFLENKLKINTLLHVSRILLGFPRVFYTCQATVCLFMLFSTTHAEKQSNCTVTHTS